jgi:hypothetical protein
LDIISSKSRRTGALSAYYRRVNEGIGLIPSLDKLPMITYGADPYVKEETTKQPPKETEQAAFKICAPQTDFNTSGYVVKDGFRLVYDPVVLQPVKDGHFLIVTAWGAEASDELVINQNHN